MRTRWIGPYTVFVAIHLCLIHELNCIAYMYIYYLFKLLIIENLFTSSCKNATTVSGRRKRDVDGYGHQVVYVSTGFHVPLIQSNDNIDRGPDAARESYYLYMNCLNSFWCSEEGAEFVNNKIKRNVDEYLKLGFKVKNVLKF